MAIIDFNWLWIKLLSLKVFNNKLTSYTKYKNFFWILLILSIAIVLFLPFTNFTNDASRKFEKVQLRNLKNLDIVKLKSGVGVSEPRNPFCTYWSCFNIYRCGHTGHDRIAVYVYSPKKYVDSDGVSATELSKEYLTLLGAVINSKYYTANPEEACIFIPFIDTLNQERMRINITSKALHSLPYWRNGENHLIFNMIAGSAPDFSTVVELDLGKAMVAGADFDIDSFRVKFDIPVPVFSPIVKKGEVTNTLHDRLYLVTSSQLNIDPIFLDELQKLTYQYPNKLLMLDSCQIHKYRHRCCIETGKQYNYPEILKSSKFCLIFRGERMGQFALLEAMAANCIPVIVMKGHILPFEEILDWKHFSVLIMEKNLKTVVDVITAMSDKRIKQMQASLLHVYHSYFSSIDKIAMTALDIVQDRVYPYLRRTYDDINLKPSEINANPLFFPNTSPKSQGFTAVILTYDRVASLFTLIQRLSKVPSLMKVVVVWNNQKKQPPALQDFPKIAKPINIIKTKANKLSNRFFPYREIETEAILHIDDDIVMLTSDEVEFAFEVWREFPDRIIGFPSRTHIWDNMTQSWKYESEWTNEISMVLTGAAFLHKFWSYLYTKDLPSEVRDWVDEHMNCEDIAMNFLVANLTNKPPIKVTPRKKFKCPECTTNEMLSADLGHMVERSQCVDRFAKAFGRMPLKTVEFRADPVLFKDPFPEKLKRFNDIGSL